MALGEPSLDDLLKEVGGLPGVRGCALVTRDGLPHAFGIPGAVNEEVFAAMTATLLGAAETALFELGEEEAPKIVVKNHRMALLVTEVSDDLLLVIVLNDPTQVENVHERAMSLLPGKGRK
jgi:uncharacterized protein